jgi:hypothetical protein
LALSGRLAGGVLVVDVTERRPAMSFDFTDLNMQVMGQGWQFGPCQNFSQCPANTALCRYPTVQCICLTNPAYSFCAIPSRCRCLTRLLTCICLSKPIASVPPRTIKDFTIYEQVTGVVREINDVSDLEVLRVELQEALKHLDVAHQNLQQLTGPKSDAEFDEAERALKQQLEDLQRQRDASKGTGGGKK